MVDFKGGEFHDGEEVLVSLKYEKLFGYCPTCGSLCHDEDECLLSTKVSEEKNQERKKEHRDGSGGDDRARSYKGVVIKGSSGGQEKEREQREYYGKGKGKMFEEPDHKWTKIAERGNKRHLDHRSFHRGVEEGFRQRNFRWEPARVRTLEDRHRHQQGGRRDRSPRRRGRGEAREEGELQMQLNRGKEQDNTQPSAEFQAELAKTQTDPEEVNKAPLEVESSLDLANAVLENMELGDGDEVLDNIGNIELQDKVEKVEIQEEDFQDLTDGEMEENGTILLAGNSMVGNEKEKGVEEVEKKQGARKKGLKPLAVGGNTKLRMVQALMSPRKRNAAKIGSRQGEQSKQAEEKGAPNSKAGSSKS
ncbi:hypothetical protein Bca52824_094049 [Brassica carinata]|uniref:Zinc knuckle CX2CX4HX4C domain-containing protein n=1 Tax=Brassica carinata TaxID=52824 RepID=A0A8X7P4L6_BRACI|nr:hypothetical protein Bca52824_094049 [Brassica carinata]